MPTRSIVIGAFLLAVAFVAYLASWQTDNSFLQSLFSWDQRTEQADPPPPAPRLSELELKAIAEGKGFDALISYTNKGFEPEIMQVPAHSIIRFTNNSSYGLRISESEENSPVAACGGFDSCKVLNPGEFWEVEVAEPADISYRNMLRSTDSGSIRAE